MTAWTLFYLNDETATYTHAHMYTNTTARARMHEHTHCRHAYMQTSWCMCAALGCKQHLPLCKDTHCCLAMPHAPCQNLGHSPPRSCQVEWNYAGCVQGKPIGANTINLHPIPCSSNADKNGQGSLSLVQQELSAAMHCTPACST